MNKKVDEFGFEYKITDHSEDVVMLESLIASPAFSALKRAIEVYKKSVLSVLLTAEDPQKLFLSQGIIRGLNVIEELPKLIVRQKKKHEESELKAQKTAGFDELSGQRSK